MSKKRTKQYLMLLMVIGLVSIAAGGGNGTFASFNAEVTNAGNYFATGTLVLNDNGGTNTCTSAGDVSNLNNGASNGCDTFFTLSKLSLPSSTLSGASNTAGATTLTFSALTGAAIDKGDSIVISDGANTETVTATSGADVGATSVGISALAHTHAAGVSFTDSSATYYAKLTLKNAGTLNASGIKFDLPAACSDTAQEGSTTLSSGLTAGAGVSSLSVNAVTGTFAIGDPVVVTSGSHTQTFNVATTAVVNGATSITVSTENANFSYPSGSTVSGPSLGSGSVCGALKLSIVETNSLFQHDSTNNALGCDYGTLDNSVGLGCGLGSGTALSSVPNTMTALNLVSGASGNTAGQLNAGGSRYFLIAVKFPGSALDNTYQNRKAGFDMRWHIDQA